MSDNTAVKIPDYLKRAENINHYYGELHYNKGFWIIKGEAVVCQIAKKLFPSSDGCRQGEAKFHCNKRTNADLNWIMLRYPLKIIDQKHWDLELGKTVDHTVKREQINRNPIKIKPSAIHFNHKLYDFQQEGVGFLLQNRRTLLADDMGAGKTAQSLAVVAHEMSYPTLIVAPNSVTHNWKEECEKFLTVEPKPGSNISFLNNNTAPEVCILSGQKPYKLPEAHIYVIHYGLLHYWKEILIELNPEILIFDEIQELRNTDSNKYRAAYALAENIDNIIGLSGTPIYNLGIEMYNIMDVIEPFCLGDKESFKREWCTGYENKLIKDPVLFNEYLKREGLMLRRTKDVVLKNLPPKRRVVETIGTDQALYDSLIQETVEKAKRIKDITNNRERERAIKHIVDETRKATGIAKAKHVCDFVKTLLDAGEEVLLFAYHHDVWDIYREELADYDPVFITGKENTKQKNKSVKDFQNGKSKLCCISLRAAVGLNLQVARNVVFGELDYSPAIHAQGEDRAHRIGQHRDVFCYYLVASEGSDERIQEVLGLKVAQFIGIMGDKAETEEDRIVAFNAAKKHLHLVVEKLLERAS